MSDRELLELAAKAAGIDMTLPSVAEGWNPLADDGDALRLAVKLDMQIWRGKGPSVCGMPSSGDFWKRLSEPLDDDPYAATRRAIVRAAAEIGRAMP